MKYADNIVKCFSTAAAVFISAVLSSFLFKFPLDLPFMVGLFVYSTAFFLYFGNHNPILRKEGLDDAQALPCVLAERLLGCALEEEDAGNEAKTTKEQRQGDGDGTAVMELGELLDDEGTNVAVTTKNDRKVKAR
mmetsp:Transcript_20107/g.37784  ORF Transcript_20107/g.37784 Transcript_20107/m.37784 type:complete len:135 (+) Transcript_20107:83-487(+)